MRNWYNSKNKVKNKRRRTRTRKGLRPSEMKINTAGVDWCEDITGRKSRVKDKFKFKRL